MKFNYFNVLTKNIHANTLLKDRWRRYLLESFCKRLNTNDFSFNITNNSPQYRL